MLLAIILFACGLALSAFFSGSETGFYRVTRVRLVIDALAGDWIAKGLLWATNNPAVFVATALVGNNVANYLVSVATVMAAGLLFPGFSAAEMLLTLACTPVVFVLGELLPKNLFFQAPNRLLRRCAPGLAIAGVLFAPISTLLWGVGVLLQKIAKAPSQALRMEIARRELAQMLDEGHAVGLLSPAQQRLAQGTFGAAGRAIREFMVPTSRLSQIKPSCTSRELLEFARRRQQNYVVLNDGSGYVRVVDCLFAPPEEKPPVHELLEAEPTQNFLPTLLGMQSANRAVAVVRDNRGGVLGYVFVERLLDALTNEQGI